MEKKNLDWKHIGFADHTTDIRVGFVLWLSQDHASHTPELSAAKSQTHRTVHGVS